MAGQAAAVAAPSASAPRLKADLSLIQGIGPAYRKKLDEAGVTLRQIAEWNSDDIDRYCEILKNPNIRAERWVEQARSLLDGDGEPATEDAPPMKPSRSEVIANMRKAPVEDDPLEGLSADQIKALARRAMGDEAPKPTSELQKRGSVTHLKRTPDAPTVVAFNRERGILQRLNRHKKYAFITGDFHGAHFSQRGRYFDHEGIEIPFNADGKPMNEAEIADLYVDEEHVVTDPDDVNLANWYERKVEYPLDLVMKAIQRTYRKKFTTERECRAFLHQVLRANVG